MPALTYQNTSAPVVDVNSGNRINYWKDAGDSLAKLGLLLGERAQSADDSAYLKAMSAATDVDKYNQLVNDPRYAESFGNISTRAGELGLRRLNDLVSNAHTAEQTRGLDIANTETEKVNASRDFWRAHPEQAAALERAYIGSDAKSYNKIFDQLSKEEGVTSEALDLFKKDMLNSLLSREQRGLISAQRGLTHAQTKRVNQQTYFDAQDREHRDFVRKIFGDVATAQSRNNPEEVNKIVSSDDYAKANQLMDIGKRSSAQQGLDSTFTTLQLQQNQATDVLAAAVMNDPSTQKFSRTRPEQVIAAANITLDSRNITDPQIRQATMAKVFNAYGLKDANPNTSISDNPFETRSKAVQDTISAENKEFTPVTQETKDYADFLPSDIEYQRTILNRTQPSQQTQPVQIQAPTSSTPTNVAAGKEEAKTQSEKSYDESANIRSTAKMQQDIKADTSSTSFKTNSNDGDSSFKQVYDNLSQRKVSEASRAYVSPETSKEDRSKAEKVVNDANRVKSQLAEMLEANNTIPKNIVNLARTNPQRVLDILGYDKAKEFVDFCFNKAGTKDNNNKTYLRPTLTEEEANTLIDTLAPYSRTNNGIQNTAEIPSVSGAAKVTEGINAATQTAPGDTAVGQTSVLGTPSSPYEVEISGVGQSQESSKNLTPPKQRENLSKEIASAPTGTEIRKLTNNIDMTYKLEEAQLNNNEGGTKLPPGDIIDAYTEEKKGSAEFEKWMEKKISTKTDGKVTELNSTVIPAVINRMMDNFSGTGITESMCAVAILRCIDSPTKFTILDDTAKLFNLAEDKLKTMLKNSLTPDALEAVDRLSDIRIQRKASRELGEAYANAKDYENSLKSQLLSHTGGVREGDVIAAEQRTAAARALYLGTLSRQ